MAASRTIKTRVLVISDTHCAPLRGEGTRNPVPPFKIPLPRADVLIHCGDLTLDGQISQYEETLDMLKEIDAPVKLVIAGNHDLSLDRDFMLTHLTKGGTTAEAESKVKEARHLWTSPDGRAVKEGITFLDEGLHQISLPNGARLNLYASPYTPEFQDWGFPYERNEDRFNAGEFSLADSKNIASHPVPSCSPAHDRIDFLITHGPPYGHLDKTDRGVLAGCPHLLRALMRARPLLHMFGHIHEGHGAERVQWSQDVDTISEAPRSIEEWQDGAWKSGIGRKHQRLHYDLETAKEQHAAFVDISESGGNGLRRSEETLLINAAIMDVRYRPVNSPWIVDIDIPTTP